MKLSCVFLKSAYLVNIFTYYTSLFEYERKILMVILLDTFIERHLLLHLMIS